MAEEPRACNRKTGNLPCLMLVGPFTLDLCRAIPYECGISRLPPLLHGYVGVPFLMENPLV